MEAVSSFEVLKIVTVVKSNKNKDELIFKDEKSKVYFIDRKNTNGYENISLGDKVLVWVVKEYKKIGYVRLTIDGVPIPEYLTNMFGFSKEYYFNIHTVTDDIKLSNYMYNHDIDYNHFLSLGATSEMSGDLLAVSNYYTNHGIDSELSECIHDLVVLHAYLLSKHSILIEGVTNV